jgi:hypothetical protein
VTSGLCTKRASSSALGTTNTSGCSGSRVLKGRAAITCINQLHPDHLKMASRQADQYSQQQHLLNTLAVTEKLMHARLRRNNP